MILMGAEMDQKIEEAWSKKFERLRKQLQAKRSLGPGRLLSSLCHGAESLWTTQPEKGWIVGYCPKSGAVLSRLRSQTVEMAFGDCGNSIKNLLVIDMM
jgi:hypothetical protein